MPREVIGTVGAYMECEICGRSATKKAVIEEILLNVCGDCLRLGKEMKEDILIKPVKSVYPIHELALDPSFAIIIKAKREALGLSREQLANMIKESVGVIERIEKGMHPTTETAKKLERALKIKILGYETREEKLPKTKETGITLGDMAEIRVRKRK